MPLMIVCFLPTIVFESRVCGTVGCLYVRLSVLLINSRSGLLLSAGICSRYRSIAGTRHTHSAVNVGSVIILRAEGQGSTQTCLVMIVLLL